MKMESISLSKTRFGCVPSSTRANMLPEKLVCKNDVSNEVIIAAIQQQI